MIRSCNPTGRIRLEHKDVVLAVAGEEQTVSVDWMSSKASVSPDALVFVEANAAGGMQSLRFEWGTWGQPRVPADRSLRTLRSTAFSFDIKVADPANGRLLAAVWGLRAANDGDEPSSATESLLWLNFGELGQNAWSLDFADTGVTLNVNEGLPNARAFVETPVFPALVFPAVIRLVLARALADGADDDGPVWARRWFAWARTVKAVDESILGDGDRSLSPEQYQWIEDVALEFASKFRSLDAIVREAEGA